MFPTVVAKDLHRKTVKLPEDFEGELNILFVPFKQWQQMSVNTWIPFVEKIEDENPGVYYYELPTIRKMNIISRTFINEGMRAGIPNPKSRARTITLYLNKSKFRKVLNIQNEDIIYVFLVDGNGKILWRTTGEYTSEKGEELSKIIQSNYGVSKDKSK